MEALDQEHRQSLEAIRQYALKDHILEPGAITNALILVELPAAHEAERHYAVRIQLGNETHEFQIVQTLPK